MVNLQISELTLLVLLSYILKCNKLVTLILNFSSKTCIVRMFMKNYTYDSTDTFCMVHTATESVCIT